jgi:DNA-binding HxlR family transcriptional regulator
MQQCAKMLDRTYPAQVCSVARSLEVVGERWSLLIVRDAFLGVSRFTDFQRSLGIARNVLTQRLEHLVAEDVLEKRDGGYFLTAKGRGLAPTLHQLMKWGDRHYAPAEGPPRLTLHRGCGGRVEGEMVCARCGEHVRPGEIELAEGPGLAAAAASP